MNYVIAACTGIMIGVVVSIGIAWAIEIARHGWRNDR